MQGGNAVQNAANFFAQNAVLFESRFLFPEKIEVVIIQKIAIFGANAGGK